MSLSRILICQVIWPDKNKETFLSFFLSHEKPKNKNNTMAQGVTSSFAALFDSLIQIPISIFNAFLALLQSAFAVVQSLVVTTIQVTETTIHQAWALVWGTVSRLIDLAGGVVGFVAGEP
jgi:hypothetical protein